MPFGIHAQRSLSDPRFIDLDADRDHLFPLGPLDGHDAVRLDAIHLFAVRIIHRIDMPFIPVILLFLGDDGAEALHLGADEAAHLRIIADHFRDDVLRPLHGRLRVADLVPDITLSLRHQI